MWKQVSVWMRDCLSIQVPQQKNFSQVAEVREADGFLVIRSGVFPSEAITKIKLSDVFIYQISSE